MENQENKEPEKYANYKGLYREPQYPPNDFLKRLIYIQHKSNMSKFAKELGIQRQYIWGILTGRMKPPLWLAVRIAEKLNLDTRAIFPDGTFEIEFDYNNPTNPTNKKFQEDHNNDTTTTL